MDRHSHVSAAIVREAPTRLGARGRAATGLGLTGALMFAGPLAAHAAPTDTDMQAARADVAASADDVGQLIAALVSADQRLRELTDTLAARREAVNRTLVDLQTAREGAAHALEQAEIARTGLQDATAQVHDAQASLDALAIRQFTGGATPVSGNPAGTLNRLQVLDQAARQQRSVVDGLEAARIVQANRDSRAREARRQADAEAAAANDRLRSAESEIASAQADVAAQQREIEQVRARRDAARARLENAQQLLGGLQSARVAFQAWDDQRRAAESAEQVANHDSAALQAAAAARAAANLDANQLASLLAAVANPHTALDAFPAIGGLRFDPSRWRTVGDMLDDVLPTGSAGLLTPPGATSPGTGTVTPPATGTNPGATSPGTGTVTPPATGTSANARIETVIDRAMSQLGVTYAWGGGNANGPTLGIRDGGVADSYGDYNRVGFDCSGLMVYAFAGAGIELAHYSGYQYTAGRQVPVSQMKRGDMLFWGDGGSTHVALYLGDGTMIEAPYSGSTVRISPVRHAGMTPYAVRMIE